ncbi:MAG: hypothetical protein ACYC4H_12105 [Desulfocucumaceae bacterium]
MEISGIMTIHPKYALGIVSGVKRIEWRKSRSFNDLDFFISASKPFYILVYITSPIKKACLITEILELDIGNPIEIYNNNTSIAGISLLDIVEYYGKKVIDANMIYETKSIDKYIVNQMAHALHIKQCYLLNPYIIDELTDFLLNQELMVFKGIYSVQKYVFNIDNSLTKKIW